jgi:hypothetical protein
VLVEIYIHIGISDSEHFERLNLKVSWHTVESPCRYCNTPPPSRGQALGSEELVKKKEGGEEEL